MNRRYCVLVILALCFFSTNLQAMEDIHGVYVGMKREKLFKKYPFKKARTYRHNDQDWWITFDKDLNQKNKAVITFYLQDGKLKSWSIDDRPEIIEEYLSEFSSLHQFITIHEAIKDVLMRMPYEDFLNVTDRHRPVIFSEFYDSGTARFASSQEMIISDSDPPCCQEGFTLLKLGLGLGVAKTSDPIKGVIAHELAHRVLDHIRREFVNCDAERQANALIKQWGFAKEYLEASKEFGQKQGDPASCQEVSHN